MKIGYYARTKNGNIFKIEDITDVSTLDYSKKIIFDSTGWYATNEEIIKCEEKPIDLVQVGDYVNGREVREVYDLGFGKCFCFKNEYGRHYDKTYKIKSIVTKEQFESMEYRIGE